MHDVGLEDDRQFTDKDEGKKEATESETEVSEEEDEKEVFDDDLQPIESPYIQSQVEELGQQGDACQTEDLSRRRK